jgi:hypothetical protein
MLSEFAGTQQGLTDKRTVAMSDVILPGGGTWENLKIGDQFIFAFQSDI